MKITAAPALAHDAMMLAKYGNKVSLNGLLERAIVWNLCAHLVAAGWAVAYVDDGDELKKVKDAKAALELVFNLDEAALAFKKGRNVHRVILMLGEGDTMISDWGFTDGDADGFHAAMQSFDAETIGPAIFAAAGAA